MNELLVKDGDIYCFKGVTWNEGWEFDAPLIIYSPIKQFSETGSICEIAIEGRIEDICIDLCCYADNVKGNFSVYTKWSESCLKEFKWRGWATKFSRRKRAVHHKVLVRFFRNYKEPKSYDVDGNPTEFGQMDFEIVNIKLNEYERAELKNAQYGCISSLVAGKFKKQGLVKVNSPQPYTNSPHTGIQVDLTKLGKLVVKELC